MDDYKIAHISGTNISFKVPDKTYNINSIIDHNGNKYHVVGDNWFSVLLSGFTYAKYLQYIESHSIVVH